MVKIKEKIDQTILFSSLNLFSGTRDSLLEWLNTQIFNSTTTAYIFTPNPEQVVQAYHNHEFHQVLQRASVLLPDGIGLVWASKLKAALGQGAAPGLATPTELTQRIAGREVVAWLLQRFRQQPYRLLLIGGREYDLATYDPQFLRWSPGYNQVSRPSNSEEAALQKLIQSFKPAVVLVAFGAPQQEFWVDSHRSWLEAAGVKVVMVVGGALDVVLGQVPSSPEWLARLGFEWLFRLVTQPWRWRRQLRLLEFGWLVLTGKLK